MKAKKSIIKPKKKTAAADFSRCLAEQIRRTDAGGGELVFVCIGTELVPGDSLGPLVGYHLARSKPEQVFIYGTIQEPVHALNLHDKIHQIKRKHPHACIIAIDASFGSRRSLGTIAIQPGPIYPGLGVKKELPPVGHISITGITCTPGPDNHKRLQDTPLSLLLPQVNTITQGILLTCATLS